MIVAKPDVAGGVTTPPVTMPVVSPTDAMAVLSLVHVPPVDAPAGAKVLAYADLKRLDRTYALGTPGRTVEIRLTGNMERFIWSFDDRKYSEAPELRQRFEQLAEASNRAWLTYEASKKEPADLEALNKIGRAHV